MDIGTLLRETGYMFGASRLRERLAKILNAAFAEGLLSEQTLSHRLGLVFGPRVIEPHGVVSDLTLRTYRKYLGRATLASTAAAIRGAISRIFARERSEPTPLVLALDWTGAGEELLIGRGAECDIALRDPTVSRRHARLMFRDGGWLIQDLASTNGVTVNGMTVGRYQLQPGDRLGLGLQLLDVD